MRITDSGRHLSPWRRSVLPGLMAALRAVVAFLVLRGPVDTLLHNEMYLRGLAPHWVQIAAGVALAASGAAFVWPPSVVWGGLLAIAGLAAFEYHRVYHRKRAWSASSAYTELLTWMLKSRSQSRTRSPRSTSGASSAPMRPRARRQ